jgi:hypothetical protein
MQRALGKLSIEDVTARLASDQLGPARFAAPAGGLFLVRVRYRNKPPVI